MYVFLRLMAFLLLAAGAAGCGSKSSAESDPPPGVRANPNRPDPEAIRRRKQMLLDSTREDAPSRSGDDR
jgi:hypothetical protein